MDEGMRVAVASPLSSTALTAQWCCAMTLGEVADGGRVGTAAERRRRLGWRFECEAGHLGCRACSTRPLRGYRAPEHLWPRGADVTL